jgi:plastocyanin
MVLLAALVVVVALGTFLALRLTADPDGPGSVLVGNDIGVTREYVIQPGVVDRIAAGENIEVLPASLELRVGDSLRIRNDDDKGSVVGPFYVGPKSVTTQRFTSAGTYSGLCTVHPSGNLTLTVRE